MENSLKTMKETVSCPACGTPISAQATACPTCRISLARPEPARVMREIALYIGLSILVALTLVALIKLRNIYFFRLLLQGIAPFAVVIFMGYFIKRHWK